jgi:predicted transcriptional regulator
MQNSILLSIKPEFAEKIFRGEKKYEYRKTLFKSPLVKRVVVYASSPVSKIIGEFEIEEILTLDIESLWMRTSQYSGIDKDFYDQYFCTKNIGHAIRIRNAKKYQNSLGLEDYNLRYAPQSFIYLPDEYFKQLAIL